MKSGTNKNMYKKFFHLAKPFFQDKLCGGEEEQNKE
jgi:hypothetical protein